MCLSRPSWRRLYSPALRPDAIRLRVRLFVKDFAFSRSVSTIAKLRSKRFGPNFEEALNRHDAGS